MTQPSCEQFEHTQAGKRIESLKWCPVDEAMADDGLGCDHQDLITQAVGVTRSEFERLEFPAGFIPEHFTLGKLQSTCE